MASPRASVLLWLTLATGCSARTPQPSPPIPTEACLLFGDRTARAGSEAIRVGLTEPVNPDHAPEPLTDGERLLFGLLYRPLVRQTCLGQLEPGLAASWVQHDDGHGWTFVLSSDARFWDGARVTARDVVASWKRHGLVAGLETATILEDSRFFMVLPGGPGLLAPTWTAVAGADTVAGWTVGTGEYQVVDDRRSVLGEGPVILMPRDSSARLPRVVVDVRPFADPRDFVDGGADLVLSRDPGVVQYADGTGRVTVPLPWDRAYGLLVRAQTDGFDPLGASIREALARDAVRETARAAPASEGDGTCRVTTPAMRPPAPTVRALAYANDDPTARALAERLVALSQQGELALPGTDGPLRAEGLPRERFRRALSDGGYAGYVLWLSTGVLDGCQRVRLLGWHGAGWVGEPAARWIPLIETRPYVIAQPGLWPLRLDADGTLVFVPQ